MINISICQILNEVDKESYTLYIEWLEGHFKIMLFRQKEVPLKGEMIIEDIKYFSDEHCISPEEYIQTTKNAFYGKDANVQFFIQNDTLEWKHKNIWILGKIALSTVSEIEIISETLRCILNCYQSSQERLLTLEEENKSLKDYQTRCTTTMEKMVKLKLEMEKDLYKRFLLVLNSKKEKIRELEEALKSKEVKEDTVFDAPTDPSGESEVESEKEMTDIPKKPVKPEKRKITLKRNSKQMRKTKKIMHEKTVDKTIVEPSSPKPSTSKDFSNATMGTILNRDTKKRTTLLKFTEEESEDELFSQ